MGVRFCYFYLFGYVFLVYLCSFCLIVFGGVFVLFWFFFFLGYFFSYLVLGLFLLFSCGFRVSLLWVGFIGLFLMVGNSVMRIGRNRREFLLVGIFEFFVLFCEKWLIKLDKSLFIFIEFFILYILVLVVWWL